MNETPCGVLWKGDICAADSQNYLLVIGAPSIIIENRVLIIVAFADDVPIGHIFSIVN
jgi:hypothetical protein